MNFKEATDGLFDRIDHAKLAEALGVSVASIRQARLSETATAHRSPPEGWVKAVIKLAERQARHYETLIQRLKSQKPTTIGD